MRVYYVCSPRPLCGSCGSSESNCGTISQISNDFEDGGSPNPPPSANVCNLLTVRRLARRREAFPTSLLSLHPARVMQFVERKQNLRFARALRRALRFRSPYGDSVGRHPRSDRRNFRRTGGDGYGLRRERHRCEPNVPIDATKTRDVSDQNR